MRHFTTEDDAFLTANYLTMSKNGMGKKIDRSIASVVCRMKVLKLIVPHHISEKFRKAGLFKKGDKRLRRGKRKGSKKGTKALWFGRNGKLYHQVKTDKGWMPLSLEIWKQAGFTVPAGYILVFKNNNSLKCTLSNLECITRAESLARNKLINWTTKRSKKTLAERRVSKYERAKGPQIIRRQKINIKQQKKYLQSQADLAIKEKRTIDRESNRKRKLLLAQQNRAKLQQEKKLKSVRYRDEISWSKKILDKSKIRIADTSNLIPLRIDNKTIVYIKPGADKEAILKQYQRKAS